MAERHAWVDYSKGICIIGVVTLYAVWKMQAEVGASGWMQHWVDFARPFRMPDFFVLSGLFLMRVIDRPWREYLDTKVVHYLYFFWLWSLIYFVSKLVVGRAGDTPGDVLHELGYSLYQPFAMLWFIEILPIFFVVTRLTRRVPWWLMLPAALLLQLSDLRSDHWLLVGHFCERYVYFYIGYRFAPLFFRVADAAARHPTQAFAMLVTWAVINQSLVLAHRANQPGIALFTGLAGCIAVIATGALLSRFAWMNWLRWLGEHSIVTYLAFFLPMGLLIFLMRHTGVWFDPGTTAALISLASIGFAVALHHATRHGAGRFLFERPSWARLTRRAAVAPAQSLRPKASTTAPQ